MELSPAVLIVIALGAVASSVVLVRWGRRHEAAPPLDSPSHHPTRSAATAPTAQRESQSLVNWLLDRASEQTGVKIADDPLAHKRVVEAAVKALEDIHDHGSAEVSLPFLVADARGPKHFCSSKTEPQPYL